MVEQQSQQGLCSVFLSLSASRKESDASEALFNSTVRTCPGSLGLCEGMCSSFGGRGAGTSRFMVTVSSGRVSDCACRLVHCLCIQFAVLFVQFAALMCALVSCCLYVFSASDGMATFNP